MENEKKNRLKLWAGDILDVAATLDEDNFVEMIVGLLGDKLGLALPGFILFFRNEVY